MAPLIVVLHVGGGTFATRQLLLHVSGDAVFVELRWAEERVVVCTVVGNQDFPQVMSSVTQATGWYLVVTWDTAPPSAVVSNS